MSFVYAAEEAFRPKFTPEKLVATRTEAVRIDRMFVAAALAAMSADDFDRAMYGGWKPPHFDRLIDFLTDQMAARSREKMLSVEPAQDAPFEPVSIADERPVDKRFAELAG